MTTFSNAGRLGNYLYEFACAWSYAKKHGLEFTVPLHERDKKWCPVYFTHLRNYSYDSWSLEPIHLWENGHGFQELPFEERYRNCNVIIEGYRQSYKYFDDYRDELLKVFNFPYEMNKGVCSIHVRRGDYLLHPTKHPVCSVDYFIQAVGSLLLCGYNKFKIFSDDIGWCKSFFVEEDYKGVKFEFSEGKNEIEDLTLMSHCEHQICSNSTMATWAAELNQNPNKIVVVPSKRNWFGKDNSHLSVEDMYRPEWIQIKY